MKTLIISVFGFFTGIGYGVFVDRVWPNNGSFIRYALKLAGLVVILLAGIVLGLNDL